MSSQDREAVEDVTAVQIQRDRSGYAELHHAASYDDIESFEKLVAEHGTQIIFEKTNRGLTSIHVAAVSNSIRIMRKLVELLPTNMFTDHITNYQESPLHLASAANNRDIVKLLLDKGIDPILVDCWGRTAATVSR